MAAYHQPLKSYEVTNLSTITSKHIQIRQNGQTILWVNTHAGLVQHTRVDLRTQAENGPIVAAAELKKTSAGCRVVLGNPDTTHKGQWQDVGHWGSKKFEFACQGGNFIWKGTHDKGLGSSGGLTSEDYKLVDLRNPDNVLAVYIAHKKLFNNTDLAKVDFFVEMGQELELWALITIFAVAENVRRTNRQTATYALA